MEVGSASIPSGTNPAERSGKPEGCPKERKGALSVGREGNNLEKASPSRGARREETPGDLTVLAAAVPAEQQGLSVVSEGGDGWNV